MNEPLVKTLDIPCDQQTAFEVFLDMNSWWPVDRFATSVMRGDSVREIRVEPEEGGQIVEVSTDGQEQVWGRINVLDPFKYVRLDFHIPHPSEENPGFSTVEVRFTALQTDLTRMELTQSNWEAMGDVAEMVQKGYGKAWNVILDDAFVAACERKMASA